MLFVIDPSLTAVLQDTPDPDADVIEALHQLANIYRTGTHLIFANRRVLTDLISSPYLRSDVRDIYREILKGAPQMGSYRQQLVRYTRIVADKSKFTYEYPTPDRRVKVITLSADLFSHMCLKSPTTLLSENLNDVAFYKVIAYVYQLWMSMSLVLRVREQGGGGSTIGPEYGAIQSQGDVACLCVSDSDRKTPSGPLGDTAMVLQRHDDPNKPFTEMHFTQSLEVENLIPLPLLIEAAHQSPQIRQAIQAYQRLEASPEGDAKRWLDIKEGLRLHQILNPPQNDPSYVNYWSSKINYLNPRMNPANLVCNQPHPCTSKNKCNCIIVNGFSASILKDVVTNVLPTKSFQDISAMVPKYLRDEWIEIGELITAWCCGSSQKSTIPACTLQP